MPLKFVFKLGRNSDPYKNGLCGWEQQKDVEIEGADKEDARRRAVAYNIGWQVLNVWD
jgi:hypothetical protein